MPRTSSDYIADNLHDVMMETLPSLVKEKVTKQVKKEVPVQVHDQVPVYLAEGLILERKSTKEEPERLIAKSKFGKYRTYLNSPRPATYPSKLPYPERMKIREHDKPSAQHSRFLKMFKQLRLEIGLKDALVEMPKFNKWLSSLLRKRELEGEIGYHGPTSALADSGAKHLTFYLHAIYKKLELEALTPIVL
ncbi:hypothetical protein Tco_0890394 [Tanacetum coccineum]|uniref:Uncharacterized protein n=1 Tax=Tanacetum coccineum TaxID=301880 RepID=A0ABQ5C385_9ASTR